MDHIGIDVHKAQSQVCILTENSERSEQRILTDRVRFGEVFGGLPRARILIEASTESEWVARCLEELGHEVIVADPNFAAMYATRSRRVKTDHSVERFPPTSTSSRRCSTTIFESSAPTAKLPSVRWIPPPIPTWTRTGRSLGAIRF
jgi:hypothetical protein